MRVTTGAATTLAAVLWPAEGTRQALRFALLAFAGSIFVAACAQIQVPMKPVPMTMQTFAVLVVGAAFGARLGAATLALYLLEGGMGLPVFAGFSGGPAVLFGPTGGYIFGFVIAAGLVGWLAERGWDRKVHLTALAMLLGTIVIFAPGLAWLSTFVGEKTLELGFHPFWLGGCLKILLAAAMVPLAWKLLGRRKS